MRAAQSLTMEGEDESSHITITPPKGSDGLAVHRLIAACPPLDPNSLYCNLLQCTHFRETSAVARRGGEVVGFLSGHLIPERPEALFVWQVAVRSDARGQGLAKRMLFDILSRPFCAGVRRIEATITEDNDSSWAFFSSVARDLDADEARAPMFDRHAHFGGRHDSEMRISIGPFVPLDHLEPQTVE